MAIRTSAATWNGTLKEGKGLLKVGQGAYEWPFTFASRFESAQGTNPEELVGAAHAGCYSMFLSALISKENLTPESVANLGQADVLIEVHDFLDITISDHLERLFTPSHDITRVRSVDDLDKAREYDYPETRALSLAERRIVFAEGRPAQMEWLFCRSRAHGEAPAGALRRSAEPAS